MRAFGTGVHEEAQEVLYLECLPRGCCVGFFLYFPRVGWCEFGMVFWSAVGEQVFPYLWVLILLLGAAVMSLVLLWR